jgi:cytochrome c-type biogenesis protein
MAALADLVTHSASIPVLFGVSFLGGLIASVSPCSLAMLPLIIGYVGGCSTSSPLRTCAQMLFFVLGTAIVFSAIGVVCAVTGKVFISFLGGYFGIFLAGIILVMGLKLTGFLDFEIPVLIKELPQGKGTVLYPMMLGGVFALAGTPCSTPILAGIMAFAALSAHIEQAVLMLFLFALGQGMILILAGFLTSHLRKVSQFSEVLLKLSGALLILAAIYIFYKIFAPLLTG